MPTGESIPPVCSGCGAESGKGHTAECALRKEQDQQAREELNQLTSDTFERDERILDEILKQAAEDAIKWLHALDFANALFSVAYLFNPLRLRGGLSKEAHQYLKEYTEARARDVWKQALANASAKNRGLLEERGYSQIIEKIDLIFGSIIQPSHVTISAKEAEPKKTPGERVESAEQVALIREARFRELFAQKPGERFWHYSLMTEVDTQNTDVPYDIARFGIRTRAEIKQMGGEAGSVGFQGKDRISVLPDTSNSWEYSFGIHGQDALMTFIIDPDKVKNRVQSPTHIGKVPDEYLIVGGIPQEAVVGVFVRGYLAKEIRRIASLSPEDRADLLYQDRKVAAREWQNPQNNPGRFARNLLHAFFDNPTAAFPIYAPKEDRSGPPYKAAEVQSFEVLQTQRIFPSQERKAPPVERPAEIINGTTEVWQEITTHIAPEYAFSAEEQHELEGVVQRYQEIMPRAVERLIKGENIWDLVKYALGPYADRRTTSGTDRLRNFINAMQSTIGHRFSHYRGDMQSEDLAAKFRRDSAWQAQVVRTMIDSVELYLRPYEKVDIPSMIQVIIDEFKKRCADAGQECPEVRLEFPKESAGEISAITKEGPVREIILEAMKNAANSEAMMGEFLKVLRADFAQYEGKGQEVNQSARQQMLERIAAVICDPNGPVRQASTGAELTPLGMLEFGGSGWLKIPKAKKDRSGIHYAILDPLVDKFIAGEYRDWQPIIKVHVTPDHPDLKYEREITVGIKDTGVGVPRPEWIDEKLADANKTYGDDPIYGPKMRQRIFELGLRDDLIIAGSTKPSGTGVGIENMIETLRVVSGSHHVTPELESMGPFQGAELRIRILEKPTMTVSSREEK